MTMIGTLLSKDIVLFSILFILSMSFSFMGLLGGITRHLLMPKGYLSGIKEYRGGTAIFWGIVFFIGFAIFPLLIFLSITKDKFNSTQSLIYLLVLLTVSFVIAVLGKRWVFLLHTTNYSGIGIKWYYKVVILLLIAVPTFAVSAYPFSLISISLALLLFILGFILPFVSIYATWWIFTLGGRLPLPQQHAWIAPDKKASQKEYIKALSTIFPFIIVLIFLGQNLSFDTAFIFLKPLAWFVIFHLGMTLAVLIKGRNITATK